MRRSLVVAALWVIVLLSPVVTWWLVGDQSTVPEEAGRDYLYQPPDVTEPQKLAIGLSATGMTAVALGAILLPAGRRALRRHDLLVFLPLLAVGLYIGFGFRVITAGVIGANIGGGILIMFGFAFIPVMVALAAVQWYLASRRSREHG